MTTVGKSVAALLRRSLTPVLLAGMAVAVRAEVSVVGDSSTGTRRGSVFVATIVDGPDPILGVWVRVATSLNRSVLNESGAERGDGPPTVLGNPSGVCAVAWARHNATGFDVVMSRFVEDDWAPEEVLAGGPLDELDPMFLESPDGTVRLFYWEAGPSPRVLMRTASPDLSSWGPAEVVSETGTHSARPAGVFHDGTLWVVYEVHQSGADEAPRQVVAARLEGGEWVREVLAISWAEEPLRPEIHTRSGQLWVDWIDAPGQLLWLRRDGPNGWTPIGSVYYSSELERDYFARGTIRNLAVE